MPFFVVFSSFLMLLVSLLYCHLLDSPFHCFIHVFLFTSYPKNDHINP